MQTHNITGMEPKSIQGGRSSSRSNLFYTKRLQKLYEPDVTSKTADLSIALEATPGLITAKAAL